MLDFLRDKWRSLGLQARYQRIVQEQVLELIEARGGEPVSEPSDGWTLLGAGKSTFPATARIDLRTQARRLAQTNPYARNLLRLLEVYVAGPGMDVTAQAREPGAISADVLRACDQLWREFLTINRRHFSFAETARRTWRDGECFLRLFAVEEWPPTVRYVDPEAIGAAPDVPGTDGLITDPEDAETVFAYLQIDPATGELLQEIPAAEMLHLKINADSNERRGVTALASVLEALDCFDKWMETELQARKLQSSIVLWRKVQGSPSQLSAMIEGATAATGGESGGSGRRERYRPGTILTTSPSTELQFLQPNTNFGDAVPLGRLVLLSIAAGAGLPEYMVSSDASNSNLASTMVAEGPAVKLFESEQRFFADALEPLWRWVLTEAARHGRLPEDALPLIAAKWTFPQLVNRDRSKERMTDARLVEAGVLSRAEVARRDNVDPAVMAQERAAEQDVSDPV